MFILDHMLIAVEGT